MYDSWILCEHTAADWHCAVLILRMQRGMTHSHTYDVFVCAKRVAYSRLEEGLCLAHKCLEVCVMIVCTVCIYVCMHVYVRINAHVYA